MTARPIPASKPKQAVFASSDGKGKLSMSAMLQAFSQSNRSTSSKAIVDQATAVDTHSIVAVQVEDGKNDSDLQIATSTDVGSTVTGHKRSAVFAGLDSSS